MNILGKTSTNAKQHSNENSKHTNKHTNTYVHLLFTNTRMGIIKEQNIICLSCKTQKSLSASISESKLCCHHTIMVFELNRRAV